MEIVPVAFHDEAIEFRLDGGAIRIVDQKIDPPAGDQHLWLDVGEHAESAPSGLLADSLLQSESLADPEQIIERAVLSRR
jgi:hypothetical protein